MQYKAHVWLIDPHTECDSCYNDVTIFIEEGILVLHSLASFQSRMVGQGIDAVHLQLLGKVLNLLTGQTIDDSAFALVGLKQFGDVSVYIPFWAYLIVEIWAVKAG